LDAGNPGLGSDQDSGIYSGSGRDTPLTTTPTTLLALNHPFNDFLLQDSIHITFLLVTDKQHDTSNNKNQNQSHRDD
jgi:hypothetical protein